MARCCTSHVGCRRSIDRWLFVAIVTQALCNVDILLTGGYLWPGVIYALCSVDVMSTGGYL